MTWQRIFRALCSLKLAVLVVLSMAAALAAGTILESLYDTPTAQFWVYRAFWFRAILFMLGVNIFCVAVDRYPWKKRHIPFLLAHLGILILLFGSWLTDRYGLDGSLRISEGEEGTVVEMSSPTLTLVDGEKVKAISVPWVPPGKRFSPVSVPEYGLRVDQFISHADASVSFAPAPTELKGAASAIRFQVKGGPMRITQDFWLWSGDPSWATIQAGPARFSILSTDSQQTEAGQPNQPWLAFVPKSNGDVGYIAHSSDGKKTVGVFKRGQIQGKIIHPGWKGDVTVAVLEWIPKSVSNTSYAPSKIQYGQEAPPSAIHLIANQGGPGAEIWIGLGERAVLTLNGREVMVGYNNQRVTLPFAVKLEKFHIDHYEGTRDPSQYSSLVSVKDSSAAAPSQVVISMNEPLKYRGLTFYQASYEEAEPRPVTSILSVNQDPGRPWKYIGSLLIVLGSILLFASKYTKKKNKGVPA